MKYDDTGLDALVFVAQGDMRQALNSMQSTVAGFGFVNSNNVFKVSWLASLGCVIFHPARRYAMNRIHS